MADKKVGIPKVSVGTNSGTDLSLRVLDRLVLSNLCPKEGTLDDHKHAKSITHKVVLTQDEATDIALTTREGRLSWNHMRDFSREFHFTTGEINFLKDQVKRLNDTKKVTYDMLDVCTKIQEAKLEKSKVYAKGS